MTVGSEFQLESARNCAGGAYNCRVDAVVVIVAPSTRGYALAQFQGSCLDYNSSQILQGCCPALRTEVGLTGGPEPRKTFSSHTKCLGFGLVDSSAPANEVLGAC